MNSTQASETWRQLSARWLAQRESAAFGHVVNIVLLSTAAILGTLSFETASGVRQRPTTLLSWLPNAVLDSPYGFWLFRGMLWLGILGAVARVRFVTSMWLVTMGFAGLWSLHVETSYHAAHIFHAATMILVIQAMWITFCRPEIDASIRNGAFWTAPTYPRWVYLLGLGYLGWFHTLAGVAKLWESGGLWANGISLQLWVYWDSYPWAPAREVIVNYRSVTAMLQLGTLVFETSGILGLWRPLRTWVGLGLIGFYFGVITTFPYGFHFNLILTGLYFLPIREWLNSPPRARGD